MHSVKKLIALLLVLSLCLSAAACTKKADVNDTPAPAAEAAAEPAAEAATEPAPEPAAAEPAADTGASAAVAATLGDYSVPVADVESDYYYFISYMSYYGLEAPTEPEEIKEYVEMIVNTKISDLACAWEADKQGLTLTPELEAKVEAGVQEHKSDLEANYRATAEEELGEGAAEEQITAKMQELIERDVKEYMGCDYETYLADYRKNLVVSAKADLLEQTVKAGVTVSEAEVSDWYTKNVAADKASAEEDPFAFREKQANYEAGTGEAPALFAPAGFVRVQMIKVDPEAESANTYKENKTKMGELEAEYGALLLNSLKPERRAEIRTEYSALTAANEELLSGAREKAGTIREEALTSNMTFADISKKYDETLSNAAAENGKLIYTAGEDPDYPAALRETAAALGDGDISEIIETDGSFYILRRVGAIAQGEVALENVKAVAETEALLDAQETVWNDTFEGYANAAAAAAVKYPANYANVGLQG